MTYVRNPFPCTCPAPHLPAAPTLSRGVQPLARDTLSPGTFDPPPAAPPAAVGPLAPVPDPSPIPDRDSATFGRLLTALKSARADARSADAQLAAEAKRRLLAIISYLTGFLDGRGIHDPATCSGFTLAFGTLGQPTPDDALDQVEQWLAAAAGPSTRATPVGVLIGAALYAVGAYLLTL